MVKQNFKFYYRKNKYEIPVTLFNFLLFTKFIWLCWSLDHVKKTFALLSYFRSFYIKSSPESNRMLQLLNQCNSP